MGVALVIKGWYDKFLLKKVILFTVVHYKQSGVYQLKLWVCPTGNKFLAYPVRVILFPAGKYFILIYFVVKWFLNLLLFIHTHENILTMTL